MTQTITISKNQDLRIPWQVLKKADFPVGKLRLSIKTSAIFIAPQIQTENEPSLEQELAQSLREMEAGDIIGPFNTVNELKNSLEK